MTLHGQLRNQRGALHRAWPPPGSLSHGGKHWTVLLPRVRACSSRGWGGRRSPLRPCHAALARSLRLDALAPCPIPAPQGSRGLNSFAGDAVDNCWSNYLPQWGQIPFTNLFLRVSFSPSISVVFSSSFIVYILPPQNKNVSMWNVLYREGECRGREIPAPDVTWRRSTAGGQGKKHNRPCSEAETWSEQTNKVKAVKLNDYFYLFPCWFVFTLPLPCPQLCAPLESSHLALVFAGHGAYVYYIYFKHSSWETDSSLGIPNTFYNQLHYWYWDWRRGNGVFFRFIRFDL